MCTTLGVAVYRVRCIRLGVAVLRVRCIRLGVAVHRVWYSTYWVTVDSRRRCFETPSPTTQQPASAGEFNVPGVISNYSGIFGQYRPSEDIDYQPCAGPMMQTAFQVKQCEESNQGRRDFHFQHNTLTTGPSTPHRQGSICRGVCGGSTPLVKVLTPSFQ